MEVTRIFTVEITAIENVKDEAALTDKDLAAQKLTQELREYLETDHIGVAKVQDFYTGGDRQIGEGVKFDRIRRITGYLTGTVDRWNNAKASELRDRVRHTVGKGRE